MLPRMILALLTMGLVGCANVSTTTFTYKDEDGASVTIEMPKELEAKNLVVEINAQEGTATIKADFIQTLNVATIEAQAGRESAISESLSKGAAKGVIEGIKDSIVPTP